MKVQFERRSFCMLKKMLIYTFFAYLPVEFNILFRATPFKIKSVNHENESVIILKHLKKIKINYLINFKPCPNKQRYQSGLESSDNNVVSQYFF